jgi:serine/threonine protein kinase
MNILRVIIMSLLLPIWIWAWLIASLKDFGRFITHVLAATIYLVWVAWYRLTDADRSKRLLREAQREIEGTGAAFYSFLGRFLRWLGFSGLLERVERGLAASHRRTIAMQTRTAEAASHYKFQENYRVTGTLPGGGSTAKLFIVEPVEPRKDWPGRRFVLKYFDLRTGSRLDETLRESRSLQAARRIGAVLDYHIDEQAFYYVMPFYEGPTLSQCVQSRFAGLEPDQWLPQDEARRMLRWYRSLLRQLSDYHRAGVVHKDVKPDNVIVVGDEVRLIDVGLLTEVTSDFTLTTHGTEYYRDPEMVRLALAGVKVRDVDARRFDIYSAGALLYFLLEGSFPACGPLSQFSRPVPFGLQWMAAQAMADASKRYVSIDALAADLDVLLKQGKRGRMDEVKPADLPSFHGQQIDVPPPAEPRRREPAYATAGVLSATGRGRGRPHRRGWFGRLVFAALLLAAIVLVGKVFRKVADDSTVVTVGHKSPQPALLGQPPAPPEPMLTFQEALNRPIEQWLSQIAAAYRARPPYEKLDIDAVPIVVTANYLETRGVYDAAATDQVLAYLTLPNPLISVDNLSISQESVGELASSDLLTREQAEQLQVAAGVDREPLLLYVRITGPKTATVALVSRLDRDQTDVSWQLETSRYGQVPPPSAVPEAP